MKTKKTLSLPDEIIAIIEKWRRQKQSTFSGMVEKMVEFYDYENRTADSARMHDVVQ